MLTAVCIDMCTCGLPIQLRSLPVGRSSPLAAFTMTSGSSLSSQAIPPGGHSYCADLRVVGSMSASRTLTQASSSAATAATTQACAAASPATSAPSSARVGPCTGAASSVPSHGTGGYVRVGAACASPSARIQSNLGPQGIENPINSGQSTLVHDSPSVPSHGTGDPSSTAGTRDWCHRDDPGSPPATIWS